MSIILLISKVMILTYSSYLTLDINLDCSEFAGSWGCEHVEQEQEGSDDAGLCECDTCSTISVVWGP